MNDLEGLSPGSKCFVGSITHCFDESFVTTVPTGFRSRQCKDKFKPGAYIHEISLGSDEIFLDVALVLCINQPVRVELLVRFEIRSKSDAKKGNTQP